MSLYVNGEKIDLSLIEQEIEAMRPRYQETFPDQSPEEQQKQLGEWAKDNVIERILIRQRAIGDPKPVNPDLIKEEYDKLVNEHGSEAAFLKSAGLTIDEIGKVKLDIEQRIRVERLIAELNEKNGNVTETEARKYYKQNIDQFRIPEQVRAAHIVVHTDQNTSVMEAKTRIHKINEELKAGRTFEELANATSDCPGNGGDLGYFQRGQMVQKFEDVVFAMKPQEISDVFQTEFGFHIAKVYDKRPSEIASFDSVKEKILQHLTSENQEQALEKFLDKIRAEAEIKETNGESAFPILERSVKREKQINSILIKPSGPDCNLDCTYCFYLQKSELFGEQKVHRMSEEILEEMVKQVMTDGADHISFGWQGGEPTLMGLPFFEKAVEFQKKYGRGQSVGNGLQTNGLLIDANWAKFLKENNFLVGLSLDGPEHVHDHYRLRKGGQGSWAKVMETANQLLGEGVAVNALTVVNDYSANYPKEIYEFHKSLGFMHHQYIPCVETDLANPAMAASYSVTPEAYGRFLCTLFDLWYDDFKNGMPTTSIRYFDSVFYNYVDMNPPECTLMHECGVYVVVEHNGDIYSCDFFVEPEWKLGNIHNGRIKKMLNSDRQWEFGALKSDLHEKCRQCQWLKYCYGGCTKDRLRDPRDNNLSHFCESYLMFFDHADSRLSKLADEWKQQHGLSPAAPKSVRTATTDVKTGPNDPCPCGSGKKYKKCCGK